MQVQWHGSPGQLGLRVTWFLGHWVAGSQNVTQFHVWRILLHEFFEFHYPTRNVLLNSKIQKKIWCNFTQRIIIRRGLVRYLHYLFADNYLFRCIWKKFQNCYSIYIYISVLRRVRNCQCYYCWLTESLSVWVFLAILACCLRTACFSTHNVIYYDKSL